jgi:predicted MFS family arabinose efflux permease
MTEHAGRIIESPIIQKAYPQRMTEAAAPVVSSIRPSAPRLGFAHQMATRAAFFVAGFAVSAWAPLIQYAKERLRLDEGQLGMLLLCLGTGSVIGMPMAGPLAGRYGCRIMIVLSALLLIAMLPLLATAVHVPMLAAALLCFGAGLGALDVTMNIQAVLVEREAGRAMMSGFHGMYSVGGIAGAGLVSLLVSAHVPLLGAVCVVVGISLSLLAISYPSLLPLGGASGPAFAVPHGRLLLLGFCCFVLFLAEGSVLDWGAVFLTTFRHVDAARAGVGYVAFSIAMTVCRLTGDVIVRAAGPARVVCVGCLLAAGGFLLAVLVPSPVVSIVGFALVGVGAANAVPVMFSAAGRQTVMPTNLAVAAITTMGYAGVLIGPALIGLVAHLTNLPLGIAVVAAMLVIVAATSTRAKL